MVVHQNVGKKVYFKPLTHLTDGVQKKLAIIISDNDSLLLITTAGEMGERFKIDIFAYVLMDTITCCLEPIEQTCAEACSGLERAIVNIATVLSKAAGLLKCDIDLCPESGRISKSVKADRDLLIYIA